MESTHFPFTDAPRPEDKMNGGIKPIKVVVRCVLYGYVCTLTCSTLSATEPIELSRIYPTPPSVENTEGEKFDEIKMSVLTH